MTEIHGVYGELASGGEDRTFPAELLVPERDVWKSHEATILPVGEYPEGQHELGYRLCLTIEPSGIVPGLPCMVSFFQDGDNIIFHSRVLSVTGCVIYVSIPQTLSPDRRKRRLDFNIPAKIKVGDTTTAVSIANISEDWTGLGIHSETPLTLSQGDEVWIEFTFNGQAMAFLGSVVWVVGSLRFGLAKRELHIW